MVSRGETRDRGETLQCLPLQLTHTLTRQAELGADRIERHRSGAVKPEPQREQHARAVIQCEEERREFAEASIASHCVLVHRYPMHFKQTSLNLVRKLIKRHTLQSLDLLKLIQLRRRHRKRDLKLRITWRTPKQHGLLSPSATQLD